MKKVSLFLIFIGIILILICVIVKLQKNDKEIQKDDKVEEKIKECNFTRTYKVEKVLDSNDENYIFLTLRAFQDEDVQTVKVNKEVISSTIAEGKTYEFIFKLSKKLDEDTIMSIFKNASVVSIIETNKVGMEQIQEKICF